MHRGEVDRERRRTRCEKRRGPAIDPGFKRPTLTSSSNVELELVHKEKSENRQEGGWW